jgi:hypothetical protein
MILSIKNITHVKTTVIGLVLLAGAVAHATMQELNTLVFLVLLVTGLGLLLTPDTLISGLRSFIRSNKDKKI